MERIATTDGDWFERLRNMEREILKDDSEALAILDEEEAENNRLCAVEEFQERFNELTTILLNYFKISSENKNLVLSPVSIIMLLAILADAVDGNTRQEVLKAIGNDITYQELLDIVVGLLGEISKSSSVKISNAVCVNESFKDTILDSYKNGIEQNFAGKVFSSENMVDDINNWVKDATNGMIDQIANDNMKNMALCLMNAIAFESDWEEPYEDQAIIEDDFTNLDGTISKVDYLMSTENLYIEDSQFTGFLKPYKGSNYVFMGLLPKRKDLLKKKLAPINFSDLYYYASETEVDISMPEFKLEMEKEITDLCKQLGVQLAFSENADFSLLSTMPLKVSDIKHKASIQVDRKGTVAAAATWAEIEVGCAMPMDISERKEVYLERPFIYAVMNVETGLPVFTGIYNYGPKEKIMDI